MSITSLIARHMRHVHVGGNWTVVNLKDSLEDVTWQEATTQVYDFNTIAVLVNHVSYFVEVVTRVLEGGPLQGKDSESFTHPPLRSEEDWETWKATLWEKAEHFATLIEALPDSMLEQAFIDPQYGNYYRNLVGIIEHMHYHLGQITLLKKIIRHQGH